MQQNTYQRERNTKVGQDNEARTANVLGDESCCLLYDGAGDWPGITEDRQVRRGSKTIVTGELLILVKNSDPRASPSLPFTSVGVWLGGDQRGKKGGSG